MNRLTNAIRRPGARWALLGVIVLVALAVAIWPRGDSGGPAAQPSTKPLDTATLVARRDTARLAPCPPAPAGGLPGKGPLAAVSLRCLADGGIVTDLAAALAGKPALLNLWAYWCEPCAHELPELRAYAERARSAITVLTVHSDAGENQALARLASLDVRLPGVLDPDAQIRAAVGAPAVLPVSVLIRADGSIARVVVRQFTGVDDIAATVRSELGVAA